MKFTYLLLCYGFMLTYFWFGGVLPSILQMHPRPYKTDIWQSGIIDTNINVDNIELIFIHRYHQKKFCFFVNQLALPHLHRFLCYWSLGFILKIGRRSHEQPLWRPAGVEDWANFTNKWVLLKHNSSHLFTSLIACLTCCYLWFYSLIQA